MENRACKHCVTAHMTIVDFVCDCECHKLQELNKIMRKSVHDFLKKMQEENKGDYEKMMEDELRQNRKKVEPFEINWKEVENVAKGKGMK